MATSLTKSADLMETFSGVRGIFGQGITPELAYRYAIAYCRCWPRLPESLVLAADSRPSGLILKEALEQGLAEAGVKQVYDLGIVPVQVCEYYIMKHQLPGGFYLSASHNEPEYNGWKMLGSDGAILLPKDAENIINQVYQLSAALPLKNQFSPIGRQDCQGAAIRDYLDYLMARLGPEAVALIKQANFTVMFDPNGGAAIELLQELAQHLGLRATIVNDVLGQFNRLIEPKAESLVALADQIRSGKFLFAAGFDCDADRVELVLDPESSWAKRLQGPVLSGQYVLALACDSLLEGTTNQVVVTNDATSFLIREVIKKHQAHVQEVEVGEINVVQGIDQVAGLVGGEGSNGGVVVPPIKCRDGVMTIALILKMLAQRQKSLLDILDSYPDFYSTRTKVTCQPDRAVKIRQELAAYFQRLNYGIIKTGDDTGGLKAVADPNSFVWFRQSKTEPGVFRIHAEADSLVKASQLLQEGQKAFNQISGSV